MKKVYLYKGSVKSPFAPDGVFSDVYIAITGHTQAVSALASHFRVDESAVKIKSMRDDAGQPLQIYSGVDELEQCWADRNGRDRCPDRARPGFHTCRIHTAFDAPAPFGTPEYEKWIESDAAEIDPKPKSTKSRARTRKTPPKPAKSISRARRNRDKA